MARHGVVLMRQAARLPVVACVDDEGVVQTPSVFQGLQKRGNDWAMTKLASMSGARSPAVVHRHCKLSTCLDHQSDVVVDRQERLPALSKIKVDLRGRPVEIGALRRGRR